MKRYRFDPEAGTAIEQFGSTKAIISKIMHLEGEIAIHCAYIRPNGKIGFHQAVTQQLFLVVEGNGWVRTEADKKISIKQGQAVFWDKEEWHESSTEMGMTAVIIEADRIDPAILMPSMQEEQ